MNSNAELKNERFKRLATARTNEVIKRLRILGNCANRYVYEYSDDDIKKIFSAIDATLSEVRKKFHVPKENEFKLD